MLNPAAMAHHLVSVRASLCYSLSADLKYGALARHISVGIDSNARELTAVVNDKVCWKEESHKPRG